MSAGTYVRGKGYTHDRPKEQLDEDQVNIMKSGAYGAFVHGLEDEFLGNTFLKTFSSLVMYFNYDYLIISLHS